MHHFHTRKSRGSGTDKKETAVILESRRFIYILKMNTKGHRKIQKPLKRQVQVHLQSSSSSHVNVRGSLGASRRRPLGSRRATLCHCATVAAAVSNFLLMGIGFAVSLLADDGPNSAALFPSSLRNKSAPRLSPL